MIMAMIKTLDDSLSLPNLDIAEVEVEELQHQSSPSENKV